MAEEVKNEERQFVSHRITTSKNTQVGVFWPENENKDSSDIYELEFLHPIGKDDYDKEGKLKVFSASHVWEDMVVTNLCLSRGAAIALYELLGSVLFSNSGGSPGPR